MPRSEQGWINSDAFWPLVGYIIFFSFVLAILGLLVWGLWFLVAWLTPIVLAIIAPAWAWVCRVVSDLIKMIVVIGTSSAMVMILIWWLTEATYIGPRGGRFRIRYSRRTGRKYKQYF